MHLTACTKKKDRRYSAHKRSLFHAEVCHKFILNPFNFGTEDYGVDKTHTTNHQWFGDFYYWIEKEIKKEQGSVILVCP